MNSLEFKLIPLISRFFLLSTLDDFMTFLKNVLEMRCDREQIMLPSNDFLLLESINIIM